MCIHSPLVEDKSLLLLRITLSAQVLSSCVTNQEPRPTDDPCEDPPYITGLNVQSFFGLIFVPVLLHCKLLWDAVVCHPRAYIDTIRVHDNVVLLNEARPYLVHGTQGCLLNEESYLSFAIKPNMQEAEGCPQG